MEAVHVAAFGADRGPVDPGGCTAECDLGADSGASYQFDLDVVANANGLMFLDYSCGARQPARQLSPGVNDVDAPTLRARAIAIQDWVMEGMALAPAHPTS